MDEDVIASGLVSKEMESQHLAKRLQTAVL